MSAGFAKKVIRVNNLIVRKSKINKLVACLFFKNSDMNKVSICTVCMNRIAHLKETLPVNIKENMHYPAVEFVLLDYNSKDSMEEWVKQNLNEYLEAGILKYYKTYEPEYFCISHSKNMAVKLATADIICLIDADNYAGIDYVGWVNSIFNRTSDRVIITTLRKDSIPYRDQGGKICIRKEHFTALHGFDEDLRSYGVDDVDLVNRFENSGGTRVFIEDQKYLKFIGHSDIERIINYPLINKLDALYVLQSSRMQTENTVLYLFNDNTCMEVVYVYNMHQKQHTLSTFGGWAIKPGGLKNGSYNRVKNELLLNLHNEPERVYKQEDSAQLKQAGLSQSWKRLNENEEWYIKLVMGYGECINRIKYQENELTKLTVNAGGWGKGSVYANFNTSAAIELR